MTVVDGAGNAVDLLEFIGSDEEDEAQAQAEAPEVEILEFDEDAAVEDGADEDAKA